MGTRLSFRPRPLDIFKQLSIVRDLDELDSQDGLKDGAEPDKHEPEQAPKPEASQRKDLKHIPTPEVRVVPSFSRDYLPVVKIPATYIRREGGIESREAEVIDYDLDKEDVEWLNSFNGSSNKLSAEKFEKLLWKLEMACARALERALATTGAAPSERWSAAAVACIDYLKKEDALTILQKCVGGRPITLQTVYDYWASKRKKTGKPLLRCLQAPTSASDTNSYNVFRPREKVNRPQTRRRRENSMECLEKLKTIKDNLYHAMEMAKLTLWRENKKATMKRVDVELQTLQMKLHMLPQQMHEGIEAQSMQRLQDLFVSSSEYESRDPHFRPSTVKRKRDDFEEMNYDLVSALGEPPAPLEPDMVFTLPVKLEKLNQHLLRPSCLDNCVCRARVGRGGRVVIDRCSLPTSEPLPTSDLQDGDTLQPWAAVLDVNLLPDFVDKEAIIQIQQQQPPQRSQPEIQFPLPRVEGDPGLPSRSPSPLPISLKPPNLKDGHAPVGLISKKSTVSRTASIASAHVKRGPGRPPKAKNTTVAPPPPAEVEPVPGLIALDTP